MGIRTGKQFLEGLRDDREIWIDGERVKDVTTDPRFSGAAQTLAELFDLQHDPALKDKMTYTSPTTGEAVGYSFVIPGSKDELIQRREMVKVWMDHTCGMFGRSMDFMNCLMAGLAAARTDFDRDDHPFGQYLWDYYEHIRENDSVLTHTLVPPQVDRSRPGRGADQGRGRTHRQGDRQGLHHPRGPDRHHAVRVFRRDHGRAIGLSEHERGSQGLCL